MGRHLAKSVTILFLASLYILGCQSGKTGTDTPTTQNGPGSNYNLGTGGGGGPAAPGPMVGDPTQVNAGNSLPGLPGQSGQTPDQTKGGTSLAQGTDLNQAGGQFASAWSNLLNQQNGFDPRSSPQPAQATFRDYMCALAAQHYTQVISRQTTLPEYIASLYVNVLHRTPESQGVVAYHINNLLQNGPRVAVRGFLLSDEHTRTLAAASYKYFFGPNRNPAESEIKGWADWLKQHQDVPGGYVTLERMYASFLGSPEFYNSVSGRSPRAQVINHYRYALGRIPREDEIQWWQSNFDMNNDGRRIEAALGFFESDEYRLAKIGQMVRVYFGAAVTGDALAYFLNNMRNGRNQFITMTDMLTDPAYFDRQRVLWDPFFQFAASGQCGR